MARCGLINRSLLSLCLVALRLGTGLRQDYNGDVPAGATIAAHRIKMTRPCRAWCVEAQAYNADKGYGTYCQDPKGCPVRSLIYDNINILKYPTYTNNAGKDYSWQQMLLIRNGLCPTPADSSTCFVNPPPSKNQSSRAGRCGACVMNRPRGDMYLTALRGARYNLTKIKESYNGKRENIVMYGLSAISKGYRDAGGKYRSFHLKLDTWTEFKRNCGFQCTTEMGLKFLPNTFDLQDSGDMAAFETEFKPGLTFLAKSEVDAKAGIKLFSAKTAKELLRQVAATGTKWTILQEMLTGPALAKVGKAPGFKINMRTFLVLTCSREKREWAMLRAGSYLHYALAPYQENVDPSDKAAFAAMVDTGYNPEDLVLKGYIKWDDVNAWPHSNIAFLENLKAQGWTDNVEKEFKKIEAIFKKSASVYDNIICNKNDQKILEDVGKQVFLIGADILLIGKQENGTKFLQPYLIEWNSGPAFGDWGRPRDLEHKQITELAALHKAGIIPAKGWVPSFIQPEYRKISPETFEKEGVVWTTIDVKLKPFG